MARFNVIVIIVVAALVGAEIEVQDTTINKQDNCDIYSIKDRITQCTDENNVVISVNDSRYVIPSYSSCNMTCPGREGLVTSYKICMDGELLGTDANCDVPPDLFQNTVHIRVKRGWVRRAWRGVKRAVRRIGGYARRVARRLTRRSRRTSRRSRRTSRRSRRTSRRSRRVVTNISNGLRTVADKGKDVVCTYIGIFCGGPGDTIDPEVTCPAHISKHSDSGELSTIVRWNKPTVTDNHDRYITARQTSGLDSGSRFSEGNTRICYSATDRAGNCDSCCFNVYVYVVTCPSPPPVTNGAFRYLTTDRYINGGKAYYTCYKGYELDDPSHSTLTCRETSTGSSGGQWNKAAPICNKQLCPIVHNPQHGKVKCNDSFWFNSRCEYTCDEGFGIRQGQSYVQVCGQRGVWLTRAPECVDITKPLVEQCPSNIIAYTDKSVSYTTVTWLTPQYTDNSAVSTQLVSSLGPGSNFSVGTHDVEYRGVDEAGNVGDICKFKVVVKRLTCNTIHPYPQQLVTCPEGYGYGATCSVECLNGTELSGPSTTECVRAGTKPEVYWNWDHVGGQSKCKGRPCPALAVPNYGAMACDAWYFGHVCQMFCNDKYDFNPRYAIHETALRVCDLEGKWNHDGVHDCLEPQKSQSDKLTTVEYLFTGDCCDPVVQADISQRFVNLVNTSKWDAWCKLYPSCSMFNVDIRCGPSCDTRNKRSIGGKRIEREIGDMDLAISFHIVTGDISGRSGYVVADKLLTNVLNEIETVVSSADLGINIKFRNFNKEITQLVCEPGQFPSYRSFGCVGCGPGMYYNQTTDDCDECPLHTFQDMSSSATCTECPFGKQTDRTAVTTEGGCKDVCKPGRFSDNGFEPCTPCPLGTFNGGLGSSTCVHCPTGLTTLSEGSDTIDKCTSFDLLFTADKVGFIELTRNLTENQTSDMTIEFKLYAETNFVEEATFFTVSQNGNDIMKLSVYNSSIVGHILGCNATDLNHEIRVNNWNYQIINLKQTLNEVSIVKHDTLHDEQWFVTCDIDNTTLHEGKVTFTIGKGLVGQVTDFNLYSGTMEDMPTQTSECGSPNHGDIVSWSDVPKETLENCVLVESTCDLADDCQSNPCGNNTCKDGVNSFTCDCNVGFTGDACDVNIDDCLENSCDEGSTCVDEVNGYTCLCDVGTRGEFCEEEIVNGNWSDWSPWSQCSASCESGEQNRKRSCTQPVPDPDGEPCEGNSTETQECNAEACPVCPPLNIPAYGASYCEEDDEYKNCTLYCDDGYDFTYQPPDIIYCGPVTGYAWSFVNEENPYKELPECEPIEPPKRLTVETQIRYSADQEGVCNEGTIKAMNKQLNENMAKLQCGDDYDCDIEEIQIKGCDATKRSTDPPVIYITVYTGEEDEEDESPLQTGEEASDAYANSVISLQEAAILIEELVESGAFNVSINDMTYYVEDYTFADTVQCGTGLTYFRFYCVPCGRGTYEDADHVCSRCPMGTYQDDMKQTICKVCPVGWTTRSTGAKMSADCSVPRPSTNAPPESSDHTAVVNDTTNIEVKKENRISDSFNLGLPIGLSLSISVLCAVITIFLIWKYRCRGDESHKTVPQAENRPQTCLTQRGVILEFDGTTLQDLETSTDT